MNIENSILNIEYSENRKQKPCFFWYIIALSQQAADALDVYLPNNGNKKSTYHYKPNPRPTPLHSSISQYQPNDFGDALKWGPLDKLKDWVSDKADQFGDWVTETTDQFGDWTRHHNVGDVIVGSVTPFGRVAFVAGIIEAINNGFDLSKMDPTLEGTKFNNAADLYIGLFAADTNRSGWGWQIASRLTWERFQTNIGLFYTQVNNLCWDGKDVEYINGATVLSTRGDIWFTFAITLGSYITGEDIFNNPWTLQHEYGHYLQSQSSGWLYLLKYGIPSALNNSDDSWYEVDATERGQSYFRGEYNKGNFENPRWWEYVVPSNPFLVPTINLIGL